MTKYVEKDGMKQQYQFQYTEVFANHYKYRGIIDSHNAKLHAPISLETMWATKSWHHRVFAFLLAVTEVNTYQAANYFYDKKFESMLAFRKALAEYMIYNDYLIKEELKELPESPRRSSRPSILAKHVIFSLPKKRKFCNTQIVESESNYPQFKCTGCHRRVRSYCRCSPGTIRCNDCFAKHYASIVIED